MSRQWQTEREGPAASGGAHDGGGQPATAPGPNADLYRPPGMSGAEKGAWLHAFDPWAHFVLRPWNPSHYADASRRVPAQIAVNALLAAVVVEGWVTTGGVRAGVLAGLGMAAFMAVSGLLLSFVAGELGAPAPHVRFVGVAVDSSCALVLMLLFLRLRLPIEGLALLLCYLVDLVSGLRQWAGFSRLRSLAAVYLAVEVGMVSLGVLGFGLVLALHG
ncbi:MAG: hypothetical protein ACP5QO_09070 [Clostridia bacterium]